MLEDVKKVVIHFGKGRTVVIPAKAPIQAIFLGDAADRFFVTRKATGRRVRRRISNGPPTGTTLRPNTRGRPVGPRGVCYMVRPGVMECWRED